MNAYKVYETFGIKEYVAEQVSLARQYLIIASNLNDAEYIFKNYMQPEVKLESYQITHSTVLTTHLNHLTQCGYFKGDLNWTVDNFQSVRELVLNEILNDLQ